MNIVYYLIIFSLILLFIKNIKSYNNSIKDITKHKWDEYSKMKNHLLEYSNLSKCNKPILWIYIDFEKNAREWIDFGTKNNTNLNMPYIYLCLKTIIDNCGDSFHVVIIDENSFDNLIPGWSIDLSKLSDPLKHKYINYAKLQVLKNFGGMFVPPSFICKNDLYELYYDNCTYQKKIFVTEFLNESKTNYEKPYLPKLDFMGCLKNDSNMNIIIQEFEYLLSKDYTDESNLNNHIGNILVNNKEIINIIDGKFIGVKNNKKEIILLDDLMNMNKIELDKNHYGVYIPYYMLKKRNKYNWFLYLSPLEVINSKTFIAFYLSHHI